jgi:hypothetical protein
LQTAAFARKTGIQYHLLSACRSCTSQARSGIRKDRRRTRGSWPFFRFPFPASRPHALCAHFVFFTPSVSNQYSCIREFPRKSGCCRLAAPRSVRKNRGRKSLPGEAPHPGSHGARSEVGYRWTEASGQVSRRHVRG